MEQEAMNVSGVHSELIRERANENETTSEMELSKILDLEFGLVEPYECPHCKEDVHPDDVVCPHCGESIVDDSSDEDEDSNDDDEED